MCSKLSATFVPFSVLSLIRPRTIKVASTSRLSFALFTWQKIPGSPRLHNFNVRVPERGSLGTRLCGCLEVEVGPESKFYVCSTYVVSILRLPICSIWLLTMYKNGQGRLGRFHHVDDTNIYLSRRSGEEPEWFWGLSCTVCPSTAVLNVCEAENLLLVVQDKECVHETQ